MKDRIKLAAFYAAIVIAIVAGGYLSAWDCAPNGAGFICHRIVYEPEPA